MATAQRPRGGARAQQRGTRRRPNSGPSPPAAGWSHWGASPWPSQDSSWWSSGQTAGGWSGGGRGGARADNTESDAAVATESLLDALAPAPQREVGMSLRDKPPKAMPKRSSWLVADARPATETPAGLLPPDQLLGHWVDSQGNSVHVFSTDAFDVKLVATLSKPPRADIHLSVKPVVLGAGWQCGHSLLDPIWTSPAQLHWVAVDGRVSVWVRPGEQPEEGAKVPDGESKEKEGGESKEQLAKKEGEEEKPKQEEGEEKPKQEEGDEKTKQDKGEENKQEEPKQEDPKKGEPKQGGQEAVQGAVPLPQKGPTDQ